MSKKVYLGMIGDIIHPGLINIIHEGTKYGDLMIGLFTDTSPTISSTGTTGKPTVSRNSGWKFLR